MYDMCFKLRLHGFSVCCLHASRKFPLNSRMAYNTCQPIRLGSIEGCPGKLNEIIYHPPKSEAFEGAVVFFGGDVQDYKENMLKHRDNKHHATRDLESTAILLHERFPYNPILVIKPSKMSLMTFSCYENFVDVNNFGAPTYHSNSDSLKHLKMLLKNVDMVLAHHSEQKVQAVSTHSELSSLNPIIIIGFSKGCIVLNQFLHAFSALIEEPDTEVLNFGKSIKKMYWLDGGHSGVSETWITDKNILENFSKFKVCVHIHVTPYQVLCDTRPRIGKEEKIFRDHLVRLSVDVRRILHFENDARSLEMHFNVLEVFEVPVKN